MRLPFACSFLVLSAAVLPGLSAGCDCEGTPRDRCTSSTECPGTEICTDGRCGPAPDAPSIDAPRDVASLDTPPLPDTNFDANCIVTACLSTEGCGDGLDEDCDGMVDEDCACVPGSTARCLPGRLDPSVSRCSFGEMACEGAGEFGSWGACSGGGTDVDGGTALYGCRRIGILGAPGALASSNFQAWLETQGAIATRIHETALAPTLRREELDSADEIFVCGSTPARWTERGNLGNPPHDQILMKFDTTGRALELWAFPLAKEGELVSGHLDWMHGMGFDDAGNVYFGDVDENSPTHRVQKFVRLEKEQ